METKSASTSYPFLSEIINTWWHLREHLALDDSVSFQFPQLLGQHLLADVRNVTLQLAEAANSAVAHVVKDYRFPLAADDVHGSPNGTFRFVEYFHGYQESALLRICDLCCLCYAKTEAKACAILNMLGRKIESSTMTSSNDTTSWLPKSAYYQNRMLRLILT
jgi:hypothetical protein